MVVGVLLVVVGVIVYCQPQATTVQGNLLLEWRRFPQQRVIPDTCWYSFITSCPRETIPFQFYWNSQLFWIRDTSIGVLHRIDRGIAAEIFDTMGTIRKASLFECSRDWGYDVWNVRDCRLMDDGSIGFWGTVYRRSLPGIDWNDATSYPYPYHFSTTENLAIRRSSVRYDSSMRYATRALPVMFNPHTDFMMSMNASSYRKNVCYIMPDTNRSKWRIVIYTDNLEWKAIDKEFPLPFTARVLDSLGRDSTYVLQVVPYNISNTPLGLAGRSVTSDGRRVIVFFQGENFDDVRAIILPDGDQNVGYIVGDHYVIDAAIRGGKLQIAKVWENCVVEWTAQPIEEAVFSRIPSSNLMYSLHPSRWGGFYVFGSWCVGYPASSISFLARYTAMGRINGLYTARGNTLYGIEGVLEHYSDSSVYIIETYASAFALTKFRFAPSDTTSYDANVDSTLAVDRSKARMPIEFLPHPIRSGEDALLVMREPSDKPINLSFYTLHGQLVYEKVLPPGALSHQVIIPLSAGIYIAKVTIGGTNHQRLVIVVE